MRRLACCLLLAGALAPAASAEPVEVFGRTLELFLPDGYCLLDGAQPAEQALIDHMTQINQGSNHLIAYFTPCNELIAYRVGAVAGLTEYGILLVPLVNGSFSPAPEGRAATLAQVAASLPAVDQAMLEQIEQEAQASQTGGVQISGMQFLGLLQQDDNALYAGMLLDVSDGQQTLTAAAVIGMTVLQDVTLTANLYRPYRSNADIVALGVELETYMAQLVAANP